MAIGGIAVFLLLSALIQAWGKHHKISFESMVEGCLPWLAYIIDTEHVTANRYDLVFFPSRNMQPVAADNQPVGKMVLGVAGDKVSVLNGVLRINGEYIADLSYGSENMDKPVNTWDKEYVIPEGSIFVFGTEKRSWDSRYWGLYPVAEVRGNLRPLF